MSGEEPGRSGASHLSSLSCLFYCPRTSDCSWERSLIFFFLAVLGIHCSTQASLLVAHGLSCSVAHGISVPQPRDLTHIPCIAR